MKLVKSFKTVHGIGEPGEFCFEDWKGDPPSPTKLHVIHPRCKYKRCEINITTGPANWPHFHWDGNFESPTITPSIGCDKRCGQHWLITNGEITP